MAAGLPLIGIGSVGSALAAHLIDASRRVSIAVRDRTSESVQKAQQAAPALTVRPGNQ